MAFRLELTPLTLLTIGLRASNLDQHYMLALLGLQPADCRSWDFSASIVKLADSL